MSCADNSFDRLSIVVISIITLIKYIENKLNKMK